MVTLFFKEKNSVTDPVPFFVTLKTEDQETILPTIIYNEKNRFTVLWVRTKDPDPFYLIYSDPGKQIRNTENKDAAK